jgi:hypothetical protein
MKQILTTTTETVDGITVSVGAAISSEVLSRHLLPEPDCDVLLSISSDLSDKLHEEVRKVIGQELGSLRVKLQIALLSVSTEYLQQEIKEQNKE